MRMHCRAKRESREIRAEALVADREMILVTGIKEVTAEAEVNMYRLCSLNYILFSTTEVTYFCGRKPGKYTECPQRC